MRDAKRALAGFMDPQLGRQLTVIDLKTMESTLAIVFPCEAKASKDRPTIDMVVCQPKSMNLAFVIDSRVNESHSQLSEDVIKDINNGFVKEEREQNNSWYNYHHHQMTYIKGANSIARDTIEGKGESKDFKDLRLTEKIILAQILSHGTWPLQPTRE
ncbi:hypothetical protein Scep_010826 [Stephania cephalantha]|uniref:Uncharacterized protein n=1 Tax=Stephania cephalantha TaxID=152367 RepID=A0AAP0PHE8_9MAGN